MLQSSDFIALGALGGVNDLARLLFHVAPRSEHASADARRAAGDILQRATPEEIAWLDRQRAVSYGDYVWSTVSPSDLGEPPLHPESLSAPVVALASMHSSGYVREAATRLLATRRDGAELPYLLLRVNDWVKEVRSAAMEAVRDRIHPSYSMHFVRCLALVEGLRGLRRNELSGLAEQIEGLLAAADPGALQALFDALRSTSKATRRAAARVAVLSGRTALVLQAASSKDPVVASLGARVVTGSWAPGALRELLPALRRGSPQVRWITLAAVCDRLPGEAEPLLRESLFDPSTSLRELARYRWEKVGLAPMDFAALYRQAVSAASGSGRALAVALRGLAETSAGPEDGALFEAHLHHPSAPVRSAAVLGLGRTNAPLFHEALASAMDDPSVSVAAEARRWVRIRLGRGAVRLRPRPAR